MGLRRQFTAGMAAALVFLLIAGNQALAAENAFHIDMTDYNDEAWSHVAMTNDDEVETGVNIRKTAGSQGTVVGYLYRGGAVQVLDKGEEWTQIQSGNVKGYIKNEYLTYGTEAKGLAEYYGSYGVKASWDDVNVFAGDSADAKIIATVDNGTSFPVVNNNGHWLEVMTGKDETAFVSADDVTMIIMVDTAISVKEKEEQDRSGDVSSTGQNSPEKGAAKAAAAAPEAAAAAGAAETARAVSADVKTAEQTVQGGAPSGGEAPVYTSPEAGTDPADTEDTSKAEEMPAEDTSYAEEAPAEDTSYAEEAPEEDSSYAEEAPAEDTSYVEEAPAEDTSYAEEAPAEDTSYAEEAPAEDTSYAEEAPAEDTSYAEEAPAEDTSYAEEAPAENSSDAQAQADSLYQAYLDAQAAADAAVSEGSGEQAILDTAAAAQSAYAEFVNAQNAADAEKWGGSDNTSYDDGSSYNEDTSYDDGSSYSEDTSYDDGSSYSEDTSYDDGSSYSEDTSYDDGSSYSEDTSYDDGSSYSEESYSDDTAPAEAPQSSASVSDTDLLAALIYCEAGNQPYEGQVAVGAVVMNRVASSSFPNSVYEVINQSGQFTPSYSGVLAAALANGSGSGYTGAAQDAMAGSDPTGGALYFNTHQGSGTKIGAHWFY